MSICLYNKHNFSISNESIGFLDKSFQFIKQEFNLPQDYCVELEILTDSEIKDINREYRNTDTETDVLSFSFIEIVQQCPLFDLKTMPKLLHNLIGVIYISYDQIAKFSNKSFEYNFLFLFSHGVLHVLGFDHGDKMSELEKKVINNVFNF